MYNVVTLGSRDYYQVALALQERNLLGLLLTDFYCPDRLRSVLKSRFHRDISSKNAASFYFVGILSYISRANWLIALRPYCDWLFGFVSAYKTLKQGRSAIVYSYYMEGFVACCLRLGRMPPSLICFQVHPSPWFINEILDKDSRFAHEILSVSFLPDVESRFKPRGFARYKEAMKAATGFIFTSSASKRSIETGVSLEDKNVLIAPYGSRFEDSKKNTVKTKTTDVAFNTSKIRILTVCQMSQRKGLHWFFFWMSRFSKSEDFEWIVVSRSVDPAIAGLLPSNAKLFRSISDDNLHTLFSTAQIFVMPSLVEGFGLVYTEALSSGTPIVYGKLTGPADFPNTPKFGFEIDPHSEPQFKELFNCLSNDPFQLATLRKNCVQVVQPLDWANFRLRVADFAVASECVSPLNKGVPQTFDN